MPQSDSPALVALAELRRELEAMLAWHDAHAPFVEGLSDQVAAVQWSINQVKALLGVSSVDPTAVDGGAFEMELRVHSGF